MAALAFPRRIDSDTASDYAVDHDTEMVWNIAAYRLATGGLEYSVLDISLPTPRIAERSIGVGQGLLELTLKIEFDEGITYLVTAVGVVPIVREDTQTAKLGRNHDWQEVRTKLKYGPASKIPQSGYSELSLNRVTSLFHGLFQASQASVMTWSTVMLVVDSHPSR